MRSLCCNPLRASVLTAPASAPKKAGGRSIVSVLVRLESHSGRLSRAATSRGNSLVTRSIPISGPKDTGGNGDGCGSESGGVGGQVTAELLATMKAKIGEALETDQVDITDAYGDGRHVSIDVVSKEFEGKNSMQRQRMVYKAIWFELQETVHAVDAMKTKTPDEAVTENLF